ncbi:unnamed protein product [Linum trigynum]|uniref:Uncharacterized protein n=1 Tax=Linum trigynum TaxID=586398 RepID=A0AAV2DBF5_9ROSI
MIPASERCSLYERFTPPDSGQGSKTSYDRWLPLGNASRLREMFHIGNASRLRARFPLGNASSPSSDSPSGNDLRPSPLGKARTPPLSNAPSGECFHL